VIEIQQLRPQIHQSDRVQAPFDVAVVLEQLDRFAFVQQQPIRYQADAVAYGGGAQQRQHQVGAAVHAPFTQCLAEVRPVAIQSHTSGRIEEAADPNGGVDHEARGIADAVVQVALQELVDDRGRVAQVGHEIIDRGADRLRYYLHIATGHRSQQGVIELAVEHIDRTVEAFKAIARVRLAARQCRATTQSQVQRQQCQRGSSARDGAGAGEGRASLCLGGNGVTRHGARV
jgi:hypothetical protein